jgi:hypothetical protein
MGLLPQALIAIKIKNEDMVTHISGEFRKPYKQLLLWY